MMFTEGQPVLAPVRPHMVRCSCDRCGAHVLAVVSWRVNGCCGNCGGYELTPLDAEPLRESRLAEAECEPATFETV
jgi:hypothetical protein